MFAAPSIIKNINNANYKGYVHVKSRRKLENGDSCHAEAILVSFDFKRLERTKTEEPFIPP